MAKEPKGTSSQECNYGFNDEQREKAREHYRSLARGEQIAVAARLLRMFPPNTMGDILVKINEEVADAIRLPAESVHNVLSIKTRRGVTLDVTWAEGNVEPTTTQGRGVREPEFKAAEPSEEDRKGK